MHTHIHAGAQLRPEDTVVAQHDDVACTEAATRNTRATHKVGALARAAHKHARTTQCKRKKFEMTQVHPSTERVQSDAERAQHTTAMLTCSVVGDI